MFADAIVESSLIMKRPIREASILSMAFGKHRHLLAAIFSMGKLTLHVLRLIQRINYGFFFSAATAAVVVVIPMKKIQMENKLFVIPLTSAFDEQENLCRTIYL